MNDITILENDNTIPEPIFNNELRKTMEEYSDYCYTDRINIKKGLLPLQFRQKSLCQYQLNY